MALGAAGLSRAGRGSPSTSTPRTARTSLKPDGSMTSISRKMTSAVPGTGLMSALLGFLLRVFLGVPGLRGGWR